MKSKSLIIEKVIYPIALYASECCSMDSKILSMINTFTNDCRRSCLSLSRSCHCTIDNLAKITRIPHLANIIALRRMKWLLSIRQGSLVSTVIYESFKNAKGGRPKGFSILQLVKNELLNLGIDDIPDRITEKWITDNAERLTTTKILKAVGEIVDSFNLELGAKRKRIENQNKEEEMDGQVLETEMDQVIHLKRNKSNQYEDVAGNGSKYRRKAVLIDLERMRIKLKTMEKIKAKLNKP